MVLTVGFPCQLLHHLWLELAVWFTHDLQLSSTPPNPPWHAAPVTTSSNLLLCQKTYTIAGQFNCKHIGKTGKTHFCFGLRKKRPFKLNEYEICGRSNPSGPVKKGWQVVESIRELLSAYVTASSLHSSVGKEWRLDALLPSSLDTRVTQWQGKAHSLPHSHSLFFSLLPPLLSHHYLYCSGLVTVEKNPPSWQLRKGGV